MPWRAPQANVRTSLLVHRQQVALERLCEGKVAEWTLLQNYRNARLICEELVSILSHIQNIDRQLVPMRNVDGEIIHHGNCWHGKLDQWLADGTLFILSRKNDVLVAFALYFLRTRRPFAMLGAVCARRDSTPPNYATLG